MKFSTSVISITAASAVVVDAGWVYPSRGWNAISNTLPGATFKKRDALPEPVAEPEPEPELTEEDHLSIRNYGGYGGDVYAACGWKNLASKYNYYPINGYAYAAAIVQAIPVPKGTPGGTGVGTGGAASGGGQAGSGAGTSAGNPNSGGAGSGAGSGDGANGNAGAGGSSDPTQGAGAGSGAGSAGSGSGAGAGSGGDGSGAGAGAGSPNNGAGSGSGASGSGGSSGSGNAGNGQADSSGQASVGPATIANPVTQRFVPAVSAYDCCAQAFLDPNSLFFFYTSNPTAFQATKCTIVSNSKCPIPGGEAIVLAASFNGTAKRGSTYGNYIGNGKCGSGVRYALNNANAAVCAANSAGIQQSNKAGASAANGAAAACAYTGPQIADQGGSNPAGDGTSTGSTKRSYSFGGFE